MVNRTPTSRRTRAENGSLMTEIVIAIFIFTVAVAPLAFSYIHNQMMIRGLYQKAVAMEMIDGEMEVLAAGEWHSFKEGAQPYPLDSKAAKNLKGAATLTITGKHLRLEWQPGNGRPADVILREAEGK